MTLEDRIRRLECSVRWHRMALVVAGSALLVVGLVAADSRPGGRYVADELIIQDETGRPRIVLSGNMENTATIRFSDASGAQRIKVGTYDNGVALIAVAGEDSNTRVVITSKGMEDAKTKYVDRFGKTVQVYP